MKGIFTILNYYFSPGRWAAQWPLTTAPAAVGDRNLHGMYYPDLTLPEEEPHYGKYGRMRLRHLKEHRKVLYNTLLLDGELVKHLNEVDDTEYSARD